jgi:hypothetical protein
MNKVNFDSKDSRNIKKDKIIVRSLSISNALSCELSGVA